MPRRSTDTREEIRAVARELFAANGFEQTSLRQIAERLDITKAALYYHFPSKDDLLADLAQPMIEDLDAFLADVADAGTGDARDVLERYLALCHRNRSLLQGMLRDPAALARLDVLTALLYRRLEVDRALVGSDRPADRVRAIIAFGGLQDCVVLMGDEPLANYGDAALAAALRALQRP
ncbi:TetR/AcrR family transcriptional regulator [Pseudonocardia sp. MH-G8]|uniref:TetR/AcrR family transcriptional regulator n=1 Tax=Pseudonocardia sp. MH-G8 TaxID=1854588 RepID=UPI000BA0CC2D|nr:TetR/AcrR family transcriptional regulator [Pseudonocardia sp. MH-G8]OZM80976.1 TetR family transcriptional regulator [Pseudonocardia sp. MH-G8]